MPAERASSSLASDGLLGSLLISSQLSQAEPGIITSNSSQSHLFFFNMYCFSDFIFPGLFSISVLPCASSVVKIQVSIRMSRSLRSVVRRIHRNPQAGHSRKLSARDQ